MYMKKRGRKKAAASVATGESPDPQSPPPADQKAKLSVVDMEDFDHRLGDYQLMEGIGKGGYGIVYRGLNVTTGQTVAVKRLALSGIASSELEGILMEIKLLEALVHPNIVKYLDTVRTADHLNIILEYVENGALSSLLARFGGQFPESLVCHYITQVLMGLHYLHQQGVIHRDIKGANILSTKEGDIKLADFGVATRLSDSRKSDSVVGTPYWMAPEIIEMTGQQSSACDIWSVGCTTLELITGRPPYFDLQQMPALFRIVQDDHPPLPDGISSSLRDFLLQCFQKDPNRRIDAAGLLRHPWLKRAVEKERAKGEGRGRGLSGEVEENRQDKEATIGGKKKEEEAKKQLEEAKTAAPAGRSQREEEDDDDDGWGDEDEDGLQQRESPLVLKPRSALIGEEDADDLLAEISDDDDRPLGLLSAPLAPSSAAAAVPLPSSAIVDPSVTSMMIADSSATVKHWKDFVEDEKAEEEEFADMDEAVSELQLVAKVEGGDGTAEVRRGGEDEDDVDPFDDIEFVDAAVSEEDVQLNATFLRIIALLSPDTEEQVVIDQCERLMSLYTKQPHKVIALMNSHAVIPIMETLTTDNANIVLALLKLINLVITSNQSFLQSLCLVGLIPAIIRFANPLPASSSLLSSSSTSSSSSSSSPAISLPLLRLEAANFIRQFCYTSDYTRKMFIACDGLSILISFLSAAYDDHLNKNLIFNAIDCIRHIFDISTVTFSSSPSPITIDLVLSLSRLIGLVPVAACCGFTPCVLSQQPKNDFCRLFCKFQVLQPLVRILCQLSADRLHANREEFLRKIAQMLHLFSQGDTVVKQQFAQPAIIQPMLSLLPSLPPDCLLLFLKTFCALSMDSNTLDNLEAAGAIPALLPHLSPSSPPENQHQVLLCMYYLCQLKSSRQEQAALHGLIPHLQRFISSDHPLKQFAFPIIFQLCKTSKRTRQELKKYGGVQFYLDTLRDAYWRSHALEVLAVWLTEDPQRVGFVLIQPSSISQLLFVLTHTSNATQFEKMLPSFRKLLLANVRVNQCLGRCHAFVAVVKDRLVSSASNNAIRVNLLNILSLLLVAHSDALGLASEHDLLDVLIKLAADKDSVLVASLAQKMTDRLTAEAEREEELAKEALKRGKR